MCLMFNENNPADCIGASIKLSEGVRVTPSLAKLNVSLLLDAAEEIIVTDTKTVNDTTALKAAMETFHRYKPKSVVLENHTYIFVNMSKDDILTVMENKVPAGFIKYNNKNAKARNIFAALLKKAI